MNHYINLLEESEKRYFSAAETSPLVKIGALAAVGIVGILVFFMINGMTSTIREADQLSRRWDQIKDDVSAARDRANALRRIEDAHATLQGWSTSRYDWSEVLLHVREDLPEPRERFQLTRLHFEEDITGLRRHRPGVDNLVHPWTRTARAELRGFIHGLGAESAYAEMERSLVLPREDAPPLFQTVLLENSTLQTPSANQPGPVFLFNFSMTLSPRSVLPPETQP